MVAAGLCRWMLARTVCDAFRGSGIDLVDHHHLGPPQVDFAGEIPQLVARAVGVSHDDFEVGPVEGSVVVAAIPQNQLRFLLGLAKNRLVIDARIDHRVLADMRFVLLALLNRAAPGFQVLECGKALDALGLRSP